jgi:hypothetical protein
MRGLTLLATLALMLAGFAGCLSEGDDEDGDGNGIDLPVVHITAGDALWNDPQNRAHPAYNFPTLSNPANGSGVPELWKPIPARALPSVINGIKHLAQAPEPVRSGAGIVLFGSMAIVPGFGRDSYVLDISDPENPQVLSNFTSQLGSHRGATVIPYPDGRLVTVISTGGGLDVWDLTDPRKPKPLDPIQLPSHKVGVVPGTPIVYNAASDQGGNVAQAATEITEIFDFSDPENPVWVKNWTNGYACHHVYFWNDVDQDKYRGVCAGIQYTQIWDTADPYNPSVIVNVPFTTGGTPADDQGSRPPPMSISHYGGLSNDGKILLMGDESGGGGTPPGCIARVDIPGVGAVSMPIGAVWFYDVSVETEPRLLGWYSASQLDKFQTGDVPDPANGDPARSCTAHHGRMLPVDGRDLLAMSWYNSGVIVLDFASVRGETPGLPSTVAQYADNSDTWETWYYNGYLFTGDLARGMDVLRLV